MNFFQFTILLIAIVSIIYSWKKNRLVANFLLGILILIGLSSLDFLDFQGEIGILTACFMMFSYLGFSFTYVIYAANKNSDYHITYSCSFLVIFISVCFFCIDSGKYYEYKFGEALRIIVSFFPLYILTLIEDRKIKQHTSSNKNS
ncbi:hypothetical protein [Chryseobacterium polytrichastri]|uniref:Uncharacterized protein n=1 Tax=Chryseobacterium polytrichastri TaxID=1302687 RepID=A0A1M7EV58_9FLAO|nr:hypothetical protein [Chryseobacterium polytrichastri]SHL95487.1 hypothetical protein SAMN05444267_102941 [Chryseobacterium polytrichastri]